MKGIRIQYNVNNKNAVKVYLNYRRKITEENTIQNIGEGKVPEEIQINQENSVKLFEQERLNSTCV